VNSFSRLWLVFLLLAFPCSLPSLHPQTRKTTAVSPGFREHDMVNSVKKLEDEMRIAILKGDASWWSAYLSDEYSETEADGKVKNKAETVEMQRSKTLVYDTLNLSDRTVRTFNADTVVVTGKMNVGGTRDGQNFNDEFQFTRVWVKQGLEWKLAVFDMTKTAP